MPLIQPRRCLPWLTLAMLLINLAVYLWMGRLLGHYDEFSVEDIMRLGGNVATLTATGDYAALVTSMFVHASWGHLLQNMAVLLIVGAGLEWLIPRSVWLLVYLLGGVVAAYASAVFNFDKVTYTLLGDASYSVVVSSGASGAIMALAGAQLAAVIGLMLHGQERRYLGMLAGAIAVPALTLFYGYSTTGVDNVAHIAGLVFGAAMLGTAALFPARGAWNAIGLALPLLLTALLIWRGQILLHKTPGFSEARAKVLHNLAEEQRMLTLMATLEEELMGTAGVVDEKAAQGVVIPLPHVARVVASSRPGIVYLLRNGDHAEIIEWDLQRNAAVRTLLRQDYLGKDAWGCQTAQCHGVGVTDMRLDEAAGKAYVSSLIKHSVSRVDLATGKIDYSVKTGKFPSRLMLHAGKLFVYDWESRSVTVLEAASGKQQDVLTVPGYPTDWYRWPQGESMVLDDSTQMIYFRTPDGFVSRLRLSDMKQQALRGQGIRQIGRNAQGKVWLLDDQGVWYPDAPRERIAYALRAERVHLGRTLVSVAGQTPLILHSDGKSLWGSSAQTGQLMRVFPLSQPAGDALVLGNVDDGRFFVSGRRNTQIMRADAALSAREPGRDYREALQETPAWKALFRPRTQQDDALSQAPEPEWRGPFRQP